MIADDWQSLLNSGAVTVVTANQRLSAYLRKQYDLSQQMAGHKIWQSPDILPLTTWITRLYAESAQTQPILSEAQEMALWEKIIADSPQGALLLRPVATAELAQQAWHLLSQWEIPFAALTDSHSEDVQAFYQWAEQFQRECRNKDWIDYQQCIQAIIENLAPIHLPSHLVLAGFDQISPKIQRLLTAMKSRCQIHFYQPKIKAERIHRIALANEEQELYAMAHWSMQKLQEQPNAIIGCVIPNLTALRLPVERIFTEVFVPRSKLPDEASIPLPFNISAGIPLHEFPVVHAALQILKLGADEFNLEMISSLLRSPFLGGAELELTARSSIDLLLHALGERTLTLRSVMTCSRRVSSCPIWIQQLETYLNATKKREINRLPSAWGRFFIQQLNHMGWPGERTLDSDEYQVVARWQLLLSDLASLDFILGEISFNQAIPQIQTLCQQTVFQPKSAELPIQILGKLEAIGLQFDYLWMMGLDDENWPPPPSPNPFLPSFLQRQLKMPQACAEYELQFSQILINRFCESASEIIFSHATQEEDKPLHRSPLIQPFAEITLADLNLKDDDGYDQKIFQTRCLETLIDDQAPPISADEAIRGGTWIFREQAACPFRAFAQIRLGASGLIAAESGLNPQQRGSLLHEILERVWHGLGNHQQLCNYDEKELQTLIISAIDQAFIHMIQQRPLTLKKRFADIERRRLSQLIQKWLALEKQRPPFSVINKEEWRKAHFGGIAMNMQIDRIDELADGTQIIIDYKTGTPTINSWFGARPDEPQLPLYCVTSEKNIGGILFAQVRANDIGFKGIAEKDLMIPGVKTVQQLPIENAPETWENLQQDWSVTLEKIGNDFQAGKAEVDPKEAKSCQYCGLHALCRILEK